MNVRTLLPFIVFAAVATFAWQIAAVAAFVIAADVLRQARASGIPKEGLILQVSSCVYFAALAVFAFSSPNSGLKHYCAALTMGWIAATMATTLAVRQPFTLAIARQRAPKEVWQMPQFLRMNVIITSVWAVSFGVAAVAITVVVAAGAPDAARIVLQVMAFAIPAAFTTRYRAAVRTRLVGIVSATAPAAAPAPADVPAV